MRWACSATTNPATLYCARNDMPAGRSARGTGEGFIASDIPALLSHTRDVIFLQDKEIGVLDRQGVSVYDAYGKTRQHAIFHVDWDLSSAEKGGYAHYMLKEIHEQPTALQSTFTPRAGTPGQYSWLPVTPQEARALRKISIVACGTAYHAGVLREVCHRAAGARARWRRPSPANTATGTPSSARTSCSSPSPRAERPPTPWPPSAKPSAGARRVIALCNVVGSTIAREAGEENTLYTYAGPGDRRGQHQGLHRPRLN